MEKNNNTILAALILAFGFISAAWVIGSAWDRNGNAGTIQVTGSAKKKVMSDLGILRITTHSSGFDAPSTFKQNNESFAKLKQWLIAQGVKEADMKEYPYSSYYQLFYNNNGQPTGGGKHDGNRDIEFTCKDLTLVDKISLTAPNLVSEGYDIIVQTPRYLCSNLQQIKIEIQGEAAKDAQMRAEKIAEASGAKLGKITASRMGVLQITPPNSTEVADYGINDVSTIEKEITAVVNITYRLD